MILTMEIDIPPIYLVHFLAVWLGTKIYISYFTMFFKTPGGKEWPAESVDRRKEKQRRKKRRRRRRNSYRTPSL